MDMIAANIKMEMMASGFSKVNVELVISPAWTTDWMSAEARAKLRDYGIAPPHQTPIWVHPTARTAEAPTIGPVAPVR